VNVTLNDQEQVIAKALARKRHQTARSAGVANARMGPQSDEQTDLEGLAAEIAFCKLHNVFPDFSLYARKGGADCRVPDWAGEPGRTIGVDVKQTCYPNGRLLVRLTKDPLDPEVQAFALMVGTFPAYRYAGYYPAHLVFDPANVKDLGRGPGYVIEQSRLFKGPPRKLVVSASFASHAA
jgi:hypothetical protein